MPFSVTIRIDQKKISKNREDLNSAINQLDLMTFIKQCISKQKKTYSSQIHREELPINIILGPQN